MVHRENLWSPGVVRVMKHPTPQLVFDKDEGKDADLVEY
jgi:hypothetical protein